MSQKMRKVATLMLDEEDKYIHSIAISGNYSYSKSKINQLDDIIQYVKDKLFTYRNGT